MHSLKPQEIGVKENKTMPTVLTPDLVLLVGKIMAYLARHPEDGEMKLESFLVSDEKFLLDTSDVAEKMGMTEDWVRKLSNKGILPHWPSNPNKYLPGAIMEAIEELMVGGKYGRRRITLNKLNTIKGINGRGK